MKAGEHFMVRGCVTQIILSGTDAIVLSTEDGTSVTIDCSRAQIETAFAARDLVVNVRCERACPLPRAIAIDVVVSP